MVQVPRHYNHAVVGVVTASLLLFLGGLHWRVGWAISIGFCVTLGVILNWMHVHSMARRDARKRLLDLEAEARAHDARAPQRPAP